MMRRLLESGVRKFKLFLRGINKGHCCVSPSTDIFELDDHVYCHRFYKNRMVANVYLMSRANYKRSL